MTYRVMHTYEQLNHISTEKGVQSLDTLVENVCIYFLHNRPLMVFGIRYTTKHVHKTENALIGNAGIEGASLK